MLYKLNSSEVTLNPHARTRQKIKQSIKTRAGNFLEVQWLVLCTFTTWGMGSIPGQGTKTPQVTWQGQNKIRAVPSLRTITGAWRSMFPSLPAAVTASKNHETQPWKCQACSSSRQHPRDEFWVPHIPSFQPSWF